MPYLVDDSSPATFATLARRADVDELTARTVLTMEFFDAPKLSQANLDDEGKKAIARTILEGAFKQLFEDGLFHGDPHPGNIFALKDGRIAYVDFGNVAQLSQKNKEVLIDAVVHAVNEDYDAMAGDFIRLGFLSPGTDVRPIVPALESIWQDSNAKANVKN